MPKRTKMSLASKIAIGVSAFLLVADGVFGALMAVRSIERMKGIIQNKIVEISCSAANLLNGDEVAALTQADKENNTPAYQKAYDILKAFKTSNIDNDGNLAFIYLLVKQGDKIVFSVDPSEDPAVFLEEEILVTDALVATFAEGKSHFDENSYVDRWGDLYSAYAPVFGSDATTVKAVVGADVWASWYQSEIRLNAVSITIATSTTILLGVAITVYFALRVRRRFNILNEETLGLQRDIQGLLSDIPNVGVSEEEGEEEGSELEKLRKQIGRSRQEIRDYISYSRKQAFTDPLTGLGNRNAYYEEITKINEAIKEGKKPSFGVTLIDINGLKQINDSFGHEVGDRAIILSGEAVHETYAGEKCFRIGGDEFTVLSFGKTEKQLEAKIEQLRSTVQEKGAQKLPELPLSFSHGIAFSKKGDTYFRETFERADLLMYEEKAEFYRSLSEKE